MGTVYPQACVGGAVSEAEYLEVVRGAGLDEVEVIERVPITPDQVRAFIDSDARELAAALSDALWDQIASAVEGRVHSVKVRARLSA